MCRTSFWEIKDVTKNSLQPTSCWHTQVGMKSLWNNLVIISRVLQSDLGSPCRPVCGNQAYHPPPTGLAVVPSLWLCHLKPHCCLADGIRPLTWVLNQPNRPGWKILEPNGNRGGGGAGGISLSPHPLSFLVTLSSHGLAAEPRANLFPRCWGSLQLSFHCLIGSGSMAAVCICYLFVPISRCVALQPTPHPSCATC